MKIESYATLALVTAFASVAGTGCLQPEMMKMPLRQKVLSHCGVTVFSDRCERLSERQREKFKGAIEDILFFNMVLFAMDGLEWMIRKSWDGLGRMRRSGF